MTIFFLTSWFPSRVDPTNGNFVGRHARLVAREHAVVVVAVEVDESLRPGRVELTRRQGEGYEVVHAYVGYTATTSAFLKMSYRLRAYRAAMRLARKRFGRPGVLHGHVLLDGGMVAGIYSRLWSVPLVLTEHSSAYQEPKALSGIRRVLGVHACRMARTIMPVSRHLGRSMREVNYLPGRYRTVSNVVNERLYTLAEPPARPPFRLLHVSNFDGPSKNVPGILRAFAALPPDPERPLSLHVAGDGDLGAVRRMAAASGVENITFSGPHTEREVAELMQSCHAFVLFSNFENQPVVLLEAQMSGRPCIATPVGGIADIVLPGRTGLLVPVADEVALTAAFLRMRDEYDSYDLAAIRERALGLYGEAAVLRALNEVYGGAVGR